MTTDVPGATGETPSQGSRRLHDRRADSPTPAADASIIGRAPRVLVVTAAMGSGHNEVARELARRLDARGGTAEIVDLLELGERAGERLRRTYRRLLDHAPWLYGAAMTFWQHYPRPMAAFTAANARPFEQGLQSVIEQLQPDVIVCTYNLAALCLGRMAARGDLAAPVVTIVVDPGAHPYWVSPHVDLHLAALPQTARRLRELGAPRVAVTAPLLRPEFADPPSRSEARARLRLPETERIALVSGGSWTVGAVERTVTDLADAGVRVGAFCARNAAMFARLSGRRGVYPIRWTSTAIDWLAAADVLVDNAGGQTCREALACGTSVVLFRPLPGHGRLNAAVLEEAGLVVWARSAAEMVSAVRHPRPPARTATCEAADPVDEVLAVAGWAAMIER